MPEDPLRPSWLDDTRAGFENVYAAAVHHACLCTWVPDEEMWRLTVRKKQCLIHGEKGYV